MMTLTRIAAGVVLGLGLGLPALASNDIDAATRDKVTAQLVGEGYEVRKIGSEDGMIEVYALKDGKQFEIYLDQDLKVVRIK